VLPVDMNINPNDDVIYVEPVKKKTVSGATLMNNSVIPEPEIILVYTEALLG